MTCQWHIGAFAQGSSVFVWQWRCWWQAESKLTQHVSFAVGIYWKDVLGRFRLTCQRYTVLSVLLLFNWAVNRSYWTKQTTNTPPIPVCPPPEKRTTTNQPTPPTTKTNRTETSAQASTFKEWSQHVLCLLVMNSYGKKDVFLLL